jgi:flavin-dependent dehydrogenase
MHPGTFVLLRQLGVEQQVQDAGFLRYPGQFVDWGGERHFQAFGHSDSERWWGIHANRVVFDKILLERAIRLGAVFMTNMAALRPIVDHGRVVGVHTGDGPLYASVVIDATGPRSWLASAIGLKKVVLTPRLIVRYGYLSSEKPLTSVLPLFSANAKGWLWLAPVGKFTYAWVKLPFNDDKIWSKTPPVLAETYVHGKTHGRDVTWRHLKSPAGPGYFVVGDAAAILDPSSSHGILRALMSGMQAAHLLRIVLKTPALEQRAVAAFLDWQNSFFDKEVRELCDLYRQLPTEWTSRLLEKIPSP